ncbi:hypothetical protein [Hufsiella ginkgonis]|uniref:Translation initiation factor IF-2 n=1 Tax=Hufsiella ginkgonis TaxID=2695274 RepID=A0A7K1XUF4_9SPHI|nr:hypothetical protein [Hufsiella ginkgonis]MXV14645.1 hypothetical protein [Hufsiella ginkgonis]
MRTPLLYIFLLALLPMVSAAKTVGIEGGGAVFAGRLIDTTMLASASDTTRSRTPDPRDEEKIKEIARPKRQFRPEKIDDQNSQGSRPGSPVPSTMPYPGQRPGTVQPGRQPGMNPGRQPVNNNGRPQTTTPGSSRRPG